MSYLVSPQTDQINNYQTAFQTLQTRIHGMYEFISFCELRQAEYHRDGIPLPTLDRITLAAETFKKLTDQATTCKQQASAALKAERIQIANTKSQLGSISSENLDDYVQVERMEKVAGRLEQEAARFDSLITWLGRTKTAFESLENQPASKTERRLRLGLPIERREASAFLSKEKDREILNRLENDQGWTSDQFQKFAAGFLNLELKNRCDKQIDSYFLEAADFHRSISSHASHLEEKKKALKKRVAALNQIERHLDESLTDLSCGKTPAGKKWALPDWLEQREETTFYWEWETFLEIDQKMESLKEWFETQNQTIPAFTYPPLDQVCQQEKKQTELFKSALDSLEQRYEDLLNWALKKKKDLETIYPNLKRPDPKPSEPLLKKRNFEAAFSFGAPHSSPSYFQKIQNAFSSIFNWNAHKGLSDSLPSAEAEIRVQKFEKKRRICTCEELAIGLVCSAVLVLFKKGLERF